MAPRRFNPALLMRSMAPIHNSRSGFTGFFTKTGISTPFRASAISCTAKGLAVVRAPTQSISIPAFRHSYTCLAVATSVDTYIPVSFFTSLSQASPSTPTPSKPPGLVRGFQMPARNIFIPLAANCLAVSITCSSVSALHGPAITRGRFSSIPGNKIDSNSSSIFFICLIIFGCINISKSLLSLLHPFPIADFQAINKFE